MGIELLLIIFFALGIGVPVTTALLDEHCWSEREKFMRCKAENADEEYCENQMTFFCKE